jgi:KEOPS complex subunit Cgi121
MPHNKVVSDVRTARCTIHNPPDFLRDLREIAAGCDTHIICFNAEMLAGKVHATFAVERAARAFEAGENISSNLEMESLLYAAGSRQCSVAAAFGIHGGENRLCICCYPEQPEVWVSLERLFRFTHEDPDTIGPEKRARLVKAFAISPDEIAAAGGDERIVDLVLERVALLQVMR